MKNRRISAETPGWYHHTGLKKKKKKTRAVPSFFTFKHIWEIKSCRRPDCSAEHGNGFFGVLLMCGELHHREVGGRATDVIR